jgi:hypothetical protein
MRNTLLVASVYVWMAVAGAMKATPFEEKQFFANMGPQRMIVVIVSRLGLANRLRSLADWYQIASMSGRELLVSWEPTGDCNAKLEDLFVDGPPGFKLLPFHLPAGDEGVKYVADVAAARNISHHALYQSDMENHWVDKRKAFILSKSLVYSDTEVIVTHYDGIISLEGVQCQQYMMQHSQFLSSLVPNEHAQQFLQSLRDMFVNRVMVGVHYRTHDALQDWAVVPPFSGSTEAKTFGTGVSVQDFLTVMSAVQNKFAYVDATGTTRSLVRFYIAANNETEKDKFRAAVPDGVFLTGEHRRDTTTGIQLALLDWLALSQAKFIINTYGSSFAEQASQVHMRPIVGLWDGNLIHHSNLLVPYCGHLQFVKAYSQQGQRSVYTEGTVDNRQVSSISFYFCLMHTPRRMTMLALLRASA